MRWVQVPDIVGSLRVDQAWGSAQIARALHQVRAGYYGNNIHPCAVLALPSTRSSWLRPTSGAMRRWRVSSSTCRGPRVTSSGSKARTRSVAASYTGLNYRPLARSTPLGSLQRRQRCGGLGAWIATRQHPVGLDGVGLNGSGLELTTVWTLGAGIQHYWTPASAFVGVRHLHGCRLQRQRDGPCSARLPVGPVLYGCRRLRRTFATGPVIPGCNPDFNWWADRYAHDLEPGTEPRYRPGNRVLEDRDQATTRTSSASTSRVPAAARRASTPRRRKKCWSGVFRVQRNFWP